MLNPEIEQKILVLSKKLTDRSQTLALAESCTGGLLSSWVTALPGVSSFYRGAVVSYHSDAKIDQLGVPVRLIECHGEVSIPVAVSMAHGARTRLKSSWALSITGIAGPSGGSLEKPVGTVCFALVGPGFEESSTQRFNEKSRQEIQRRSALFALEMLATRV